MYQLLALLTGILLSIMISVNGNLSDQYGAILAAVIIHVVGSISAFLLCLTQKEKNPLHGHHPKWIYLGGAIGVCTTVFNNLAYGHISVTSIVALGLLGQTVTSLFIDTYGLFGMKKQSFNKNSILGFAVSFLGILLMLDQSVAGAIIAVFISFCAGISVVLSRSVNARLAEKTGALRGSLINHLVGLPITIIVALFAKQFSSIPSISAFHPWIYFGGIFGVAVIFLCNLTVPRISAFYLTLLTFVGQVFTGILLDLIFGDHFSRASFVGGIIIIFGIAINFIIERIHTYKNEKERAYWSKIKRAEEEHRKVLLKIYEEQQTPDIIAKK
ncbi:DMT family transporter [Kineothrix sedimenti]|uniref:DMT family transporter n=1 Tax=Kineothrix sedimenti TaxID=3123317 RepID=A0ABZ3F302_9FIRM